MRSGAVTAPRHASSRRDRRRWLIVRLCASVAAFTLAIGATALGDEQDPAQAPSPAAVPAYRQANNIAVLTVEGVVDSVTLMSLERRLKRALDDGAQAIVIELDTPGGEMYTTLDICRLIKDDAPVNTIAWVHPDAYSAGTIIALACREIVVSPNSTFGDAAPINAPLGMLIAMPDAERAKTEAPILAEVRDSARRNAYDENLVQAFVSVGVELWLIENQQTGQRIFVDRNEYRIAFGEDPTTTKLVVAPPPEVKAAAVAQSGQFTPPPAGTDPDFDPDEIANQIEQAQDRPPLRQPLTEADLGQWNVVGQVIGPDQLLTLKPAEALHYGLATTIIANDNQLKAYFGATTLRRYDGNWSEGLVRFLINPIVRAVLIVIFLIALFIELSAPGLGVFGGTALAALLLLIGAPYLAGLAQWWDILAIIAGIALVLIELFLIPGTGIAGILGAVCLLGGIIGTFISGDLGSSTGQSELWTGVLTTFSALFAGGVGMWLVSRHLHSMPVLSRAILNAELGERSEAPGLLASMGPVPAVGIQVGTIGVTETGLRPSGRAMFDGRMHEVTSVSGYIAKGVAVRVVAVTSFGLEVEEHTA